MECEKCRKTVPDESKTCCYCGAPVAFIINQIDSDFVADDETETKKLFYKNGQIEEEWAYKNSKKEGLYKLYYISGKLQEEGEHKGGREEGPYKLYYENGRLKEEGTHKNGKEDGLVKKYYENGKLRESGTYKDGKEYGSFKKFSENGLLQWLLIALPSPLSAKILLQDKSSPMVKARVLSALDKTFSWRILIQLKIINEEKFFEILKSLDNSVLNDYLFFESIPKREDILLKLRKITEA
jgi:hypothetical protein